MILQVRDDLKPDKVTICAYLKFWLKTEISFCDGLGANLTRFGSAYLLGCQPKNRGKKPKMDGLFHGKPYEQMDDLGGFPIFLETPRSCNQKHHAFCRLVILSWELTYF